MDLLVDIGNSRLKWALSGFGAIRPGEPFFHGHAPLETGLAKAWAEIERPQRIVVSNVAGEDVARRLDEWVTAHWGRTAYFARSRREAHGVRSGYRDAEKLGVDRWACLVAVRHFHRLPACVVDCGTAITLDVVDAGGQHLGGLIVPGVNLMRRALSQGTHDIAEVTGASRGLLADHTGAAIENGILSAAAGMVERTVRGLSSLGQGPISVVFTGGDAAAVAAWTAVDARLEPHLVLQGLSVIANGL